MALTVFAIQLLTAREDYQDLNMEVESLCTHLLIKQIFIKSLTTNQWATLEIEAPWEDNKSAIT